MALFGDSSGIGGTGGLFGLLLLTKLLNKDDTPIDPNLVTLAAVASGEATLIEAVVVGKLLEKPATPTPPTTTTTRT